MINKNKLILKIINKRKINNYNIINNQIFNSKNKMILKIIILIIIFVKILLNY